MHTGGGGGGGGGGLKNAYLQTGRSSLSVDIRSK
jgi:hypothetical protein